MIEKEYLYPSPPFPPTARFVQTEDNVWLSRLFGLWCGNRGEEGPAPHAHGLMAVKTNNGRFEAPFPPPASGEFGETECRLSRSEPDGLRFESRWRFDADAGICSRKDKITNNGRKPVTLFSCLSRFVFTPGRYEIHSQSSRWSRENQGAWRALGHEGLSLTCQGGRTCHGCAPYLAMKPSGGGDGVAFHLLPTGNWLMRTRQAVWAIDSEPYVIIECGPAERDFRLELKPGETFSLPELLIQSLPEGNPCRAAPAFHQYVLQHHCPTTHREPPVCYNTWLDIFDSLSPARLRRQLAAAKKTGCEVFVIDAGWFGQGEGGWFEQAGDWREKEGAAFGGKMKDFAGEVRAAGLKFGLWMEPEHFAPQSPAVREHPEWFLPSWGARPIDLSIPAAREYLYGEIRRLLDTYEPGWFKIDFSVDLGCDPSGAEFSGYYHEWYAMLGRIRGEYPGTFFEGCASGGMRSDLNTAGCHDLHFLSDNVNPFDVLRIYQGALLRLPPGRLMTMPSLRAAAAQAGEDAPAGILPDWVMTPRIHGWDDPERVTPDFAARAGLLMVFGLSGDLAGLPEEALERLAFHVRFYKQWRGFLRNASAHLLTPPRPLGDRSGWAAFQFTHPQKDESLLYVFRLGGMISRRTFRLRGLRPETTYQVAGIDCPDGAAEEKGAKLRNTGLTVEIPQTNQAKIYCLTIAK